MAYRMKIALTAICAAVSAPALAQEAPTGTASADATVTIIVPITVEKDFDLAFGTVARPLAGGSGTVSISEVDGDREVTGGVVEVTDTATPPGRAVFSVSGDASRAYTATIPESFNLVSGTDVIEVAVTSTLGTGEVSTTLDSGGAATIGVGGNFTITGDTPAALYAGTFEVSVAYN